MPKKENIKQVGLALGKENYILLIIAVAIVIIGFALMTGSGNEDPEVFNESIYGFRRITLAPMVVLAGFIFGIYAIMKKTKADNKEN